MYLLHLRIISLTVSSEKTYNILLWMYTDFYEASFNLFSALNAFGRFKAHAGFMYFNIKPEFLMKMLNLINLDLN